TVLHKIHIKNPKTPPNKNSPKINILSGFIQLFAISRYLNNVTFFAFFRHTFVDQTLLQDSNTVVDNPVHYQARREEQHKYGEDNRHDFEDFRLHRISWLRI